MIFGFDKAVARNDRPHLLHLVGLRFSISRLQIEDVLHAFSTEDMVAASNPFLKAQPLEDSHKFTEYDI